MERSWMPPRDAGVRALKGLGCLEGGALQEIVVSVGKGARKLGLSHLIEGAL